MASSNITYFENPGDLDEACNSFIKKTERVLDIGCGIRPQKYFKPYLHVCLEPFQEYIDILNIHYGHNPGFLILAGLAQDTLKSIPDKSFDSVFLIDVIEHIEKDDGFALLKEMRRIARKQILLFTPLGFMPQHYEEGDKDAWGLGGTELQEHRSGWKPDDFDSGWCFYVCKEYHKPVKPAAGQKIFGAFWAVFNVPDEEGKQALEKKTLYISERIETTDKISALLRDRLKPIQPDQYAVLSLESELNPGDLWMPRFLKNSATTKSAMKVIMAFRLILKYKISSGFQKISYVGNSKKYGLCMKLAAAIFFMTYEEENWH
ncbi:MAG: methionine biosynthesis protein MetW [Micavibrio sp.]